MRQLCVLPIYHLIGGRLSTGERTMMLLSPRGCAWSEEEDVEDGKPSVLPSHGTNGTMVRIVRLCSRSSSAYSPVAIAWPVRLRIYELRFPPHLHQQAWSSGYDFCLTTQVFGYTEGSEFDSQGL